MEIDHICANPSCDCHVGHAGEYCSDICRKHPESPDGKPGHCTCGHADCGTSTPETLGTPDQNGGD